jgi:hypothetical protein
MLGYELGTSGSRFFLVVDSCEFGNELSATIKCRKLLAELCGYLFLKNACSAESVTTFDISS